MKWFDNLKIKAKMLLVFAIVLVFTLAVAIVGLVGMIRLGSNVSNEANSLLPRVQDILTIKECQTAILSTERILALPGLGADKRQEQYAILADQESQIEQAIIEVDGLALSGTAKDDWNSYKELEKVWRAGVDRFLAASKQIDASVDQTSIDTQYAALMAMATGDNETSYNAVDESLDGMSDYNATDSATALKDTQKTSSLMLILLAILSPLAIIVGIFMSANVSGQIGKQIQKLVDAAKQISKGNIDVRLEDTGKDEIGVLSNSFQDMIEALKLLVTDVNRLLSATDEGNLSVRADSAQHSGEFRNIIQGFNITLDTIVRPVQEATSVLLKTSVNDLSCMIEGSYKGDMKVMADALNGTIVRLKSIQSIFVNMAKGDLSQLDEFKKVGKRSEKDIMLPSVIIMMQTLNDVSNEAYSLSTEAAKGNLDIRGDASRYDGIYRQLLNGINGLIDAMVTPLNESIGVLDAMASNDFTRSMSEEYQGSFANLSSSINSTMATLNETLGDISTSAEQVASGTQQVSSGAQALSQGATEQASAIEQLTASVTDIASQTRQNAVHANQANEFAISAKEEAADGNMRMQELRRAMKEINEASANISKIIKVIDEIAFQTNLLALNAAVEAARAGQHGKGFAVVAEEVRNLAQRSAGAAKETTEMIEESIKKVKAGTKMADETAQALNKIVSGIEKATELVGGIATASNDQATAVAQVNRGIEQVAQVVQTNSATAEESAAASEELSSQAVLLKEMVGKFALSGQASHIGAPRQARSLPEGRRSPAKPRIAMNDREFGKY